MPNTERRKRDSDNFTLRQTSFYLPSRLHRNVPTSGKKLQESTLYADETSFRSDRARPAPLHGHHMMLGIRSSLTSADWRPRPRHGLAMGAMTVMFGDGDVYHMSGEAVPLVECSQGKRRGRYITAGAPRDNIPANVTRADEKTTQAYQQSR